MDGFTHQWPCSNTNNYLQVVRLRLDCDWSVVANSSLSSWLTSPHKLPQCSKQWNNTLHPAFTIPTQSHVWWWWSPQLRFQQGFTQIDLIWWIWKPSLHYREFTGCLYHSRLVERQIGSRGSSFESIWILKPWLECDRCLINCYFDFCWFFISLFETATRFVEHLHLLQEQLIHLMNVQLSGGNLFL